MSRPRLGSERRSSPRQGRIIVCVPAMRLLWWWRSGSRSPTSSLYRPDWVTIIARGPWSFRRSWPARCPRGVPPGIGWRDRPRFMQSAKPWCRELKGAEYGTTIQNNRTAPGLLRIASQAAAAQCRRQLRCIGRSSGPGSPAPPPGPRLVVAREAPHRHRRIGAIIRVQTTILH